MTGDGLLVITAHVAAAFLVVSGAAKWGDPDPAGAALRAFAPRLTDTTAVMVARLVGTSEITLGAGALAVGRTLIWWACAATYALFTLVQGVLVRRRTDTPCGCVGRGSAPAGPATLTATLACSGVAAVAAIRNTGGTADEIDGALTAVVYLLGLLAGVGALYALHTTRRPAARDSAKPPTATGPHRGPTDPPTP